MPNQFAATIDSFVFQAKDLLVQHQQFRSRIKSFQKDPARDFLAEIGGAVGRDLFNSQVGRTMGKAFTKGYLESQESQQLSQEAQRLNTSLSILLAGVRSFLSSVSTPRPGLKPPGNGSLLLRRLRPADEAMKFDTKLRRIVSILQAIREEPLIHNSGIQQWREQEKRQEFEASKPYGTMRLLETKLRSFILSKLNATGPNWWSERIPADVRQRAEERKQRNERLYPWQSEQDLNPINFVDFPDYAKIILKRDNWEQVFSSTFRDKEIVSAKLRELEPIRNAISHFRPLSKSQQDKLELYAAELIGNLEE